MIDTPLLFDITLGALLTLAILITIKATEKSPYVWVNRKLIHMVSGAAALAYAYVFHERWVFVVMALVFSLMTYLPHVKGRLMNSFQIEGNYGEVYYCLAWLLISFTLWDLDRVLAGMAMLFMAFGDASTGLARFLYFKYIMKKYNPVRRKHWIGSIAMFITCTLIAYLMKGSLPLALLMALTSTLVEIQPWLDDNIAVPLAACTLGILLYR